MLKTFPLLLLLAGCFEQGLMNNKPSLTSGSSSDANSSDGPVDPKSLVAAIRVERAINVESARNPEYVKTSFADKVFNGVDIQGYGAGENGETFCLSNEIYPVTNAFDDPSKCRRPLNSTAYANEVESELLEILQAEPHNLENAKGLPLVIQTLQLFFSHKTSEPNPYPNTFSIVGTVGLRIQIKTAPIKWDNDRKMLFWDTGKIATFNYALSDGPECIPSAPNAVSIDILHDPSLDICSARNFLEKKCVPRNYHFLTGLWVYERGLSRPFEGQTVAPIGGYSGGGSAPSSLFSTRTKVFASFVLPVKVGNEADFHHFPGTNTESPDRTRIPSPIELSFGMYRAPNTLPISDSATLRDNDISDRGMSRLDGVVATPTMGKYTNGGVLVDAANYQGSSWEQRAIVGICVQGNRHYYSGSEIINNVVTPTEDEPAYPVVHALKYQLRKIKAYLKPVSQ